MAEWFRQVDITDQGRVEPAVGGNSWADQDSRLCVELLGINEGGSPLKLDAKRPQRAAAAAGSTNGRSAGVISFGWNPITAGTPLSTPPAAADAAVVCTRDNSKIPSGASS